MELLDAVRREGPSLLEGFTGLLIDEDGTVWSADGKLYWPGIDSMERLDPFRKSRPDYYWKVASWMSDPGNWRSESDARDADDPLSIWCHPDAAPRHLECVLDVGSREGILIEAFALRLGEDPVPLRYERGTNFDWVSHSHPEREPVELVLRVVDDSPKLLPALEYGARRGYLTFDDRKSVGTARAPQMAELRGWLDGLPDEACILLDSRSGVRIHQLADTIRVLLEQDRPNFAFASPIPPDER